MWHSWGGREMHTNFGRENLKYKYKKLLSVVENSNKMYLEETGWNGVMWFRRGTSGGPL
jgi:hypothetical protein